MSTDVLSHVRKLLLTWRQFFYHGQGSEGFWLIEGSSYDSPSLRSESIKEEMQPKQTDGWIRRGMLLWADTQVAQALGNHTKPFRGAKMQRRVLEPWETACALPQRGRLGIVTDPKVVKSAQSWRHPASKQSWTPGRMRKRCKWQWRAKLAKSAETQTPRAPGRLSSSQCGATRTSSEPLRHFCKHWLNTIWASGTKTGICLRGPRGLASGVFINT